MNIDKPQISLKNISKKYGNHKILENINLDIYQGDFICIFGKSGGGMIANMFLLVWLA